MKKLAYTLFAMVAFMAAFASCTRTAEEDFQAPRQEKLTTIQAYFAEAPVVKTTYNMDANKATFAWQDGDNIDVSVYNSAKDIRSYVVFTRMASSDPTTVQDGDDNVFKDGQNGNRTFSSLSGYVLDEYAFYPSQLDESAQNGAYAPDWSVVSGKLYMDLPSNITPPSGNPLAVVPMVGKKDGSGKYAFTQLTSVLAFHITGLPDDADFISLTHPDVALAGAFEVTETERGAVIEYGKVVNKADEGLVQNFQDAGSSASFYFSLPVGVIPAGLVLTVGRKADTDSWMTKTTTKPITMVRGAIANVNVDIPYTPADQQWEPYGTATFKDDFLWTYNTGFTSPTWVHVNVERSGLHPEKFRINNPYTVACTDFGYAPYTEGVTSDEYFVFSVSNGGTVTYPGFRTGVEDKASAGFPMKLNNSGSNTKVVSRFRNGDFYELQFGTTYTKYEDASYCYTKNNPAVLHLVMDLPAEDWTKVADGTFIDEKMWSLHGWGTTTVPVELYQSSLFEARYRVPNPYLIAKTQFSYSTYTEGIQGDPYLEFSILDGDAVKFTTFNAGIEDKASGGKAMKVWYPSDFGSSYTTALAGNIVTSYWAIGLPENVELYPIYSGVSDSGYKYTDQGTNRARLSFPDVGPQLTWNKVAEGIFIDEKVWGLHSWGSTKVPIELYQSSINEKHFRIPNPYLVAKEQFGYSTYTEGIEGDSYLEFIIKEDNTVKFTTFKAGIEDRTSGGFPLKIYYPSDYGSYDGAVEATCVKSYTNIGLPEELELYSILVDVNGGSGNYYTQWSANKMRISFPEEKWTVVGELSYKDDFIFNERNGKPKDSSVQVNLEQSSVNPNRFRIANPYPALCDALGVAKYTTDVSEYIVMTVDNNDKINFEEFRPGVGDGTKELMICDPADWNTKRVGGYDATTGNSRVDGYDASGIPAVIRLCAVYHEVGNYNGPGTTGNYMYTRDSDSSKDIIVIAASFPLDSWTSLGNGRFKDKFVWGIAELTDYATVEFQQNVNYPTKFRIAKPYPGTNSGEWFAFDVTDPKQVVLDKYYLDYEVTAEGKEIYKPFIKDYYSSSYSKVLETQANGLPALVSLGVCYRYEPFTSYDHEIGRDHEMCAIEIIFPGCESYYKLTVKHYSHPIEKSYNSGHNPVAALSLPSGSLTKLVVKVTGVDPADVGGLRLYQNGWMESNYVAPDENGVVTMTEFTSPSVSSTVDLNLKMNTNPVGSTLRFEVLEAKMNIGGGEMTLPIIQDKTHPHYPGVIVNTGGDKATVRGFEGNVEETIASFRIPALVTTNAGTLIAAYDVRYKHSGDLSADIDVGVKRSTDGGKTWSNLVLAMDMGTYGYTPTSQAEWEAAQKQNGIGDATLLVDENTGRIFCFATWAHGHANDGDSRSLAYAGKGFGIADTPQFMMVYSDDDGVTWSEPVNLTRQVKKYDWRMTFQGPGRGITMKDGTLVIPMQHQEGESKIMHGLYPLNSGIAYSTDHGETWHMHNYAFPVTSECAVAEIEPGVLLLTMRDETNSGVRRNYITTDLGYSWTKHVSDGKLIDSTCEASILHVNASDNVLGRDLVLFANPMNAGGRSNYHLQASLDGAQTWPYKVCFDPNGALGYTCLTMIDNATVGVLYEGSRGNIFFQAIPLEDFIHLD